MARQYRKVRDEFARVPAFLAAIQAFPNVSNACVVSKLSPAWVYRQRKQNPDFQEQIDEAMAIGLQHVEDLAMQRAFKGYEKGVYYQGEKVGTEYEPSDRLAEFMLKANKPEKYREGNLTFNMGNNSLVNILSGMPRSDAIEHKEPLEIKAVDVKTEV